jgi:hypothetical protein
VDGGVGLGHHCAGHLGQTRVQWMWGLCRAGHRPVQMGLAWSRRLPGEIRGSPASYQVEPGFHRSGGLARTFMLPNRAMGLIKRGATVSAWSG